MKKTLLFLGFSVFLAACTLPFGKNKKSALNINSEPKATVFLNEEHTGTTPLFTDSIKPGEYTIKLSLEENPDITWQTQVTLKPQLLTSITKTFGSTEEESSHVILSLETLASSEATEVTIISLPDSVVVKLDSQPVGFSPLNLDDVSPGDHEIILGSPGYRQLTIPVKAIKGHKLTISTKLAKDKGVKIEDSGTEATSSALLKPDSTPSSTPLPRSTPKTNSGTATSSATPNRPYVEIDNEEDGYVNLRSEPTVSEDTFIGSLDHSETFPFIEKNEVGWYKIEYEPGKEGWISSRYAKLYQ